MHFQVRLLGYFLIHFCAVPFDLHQSYSIFKLTALPLFWALFFSFYNAIPLMNFCFSVCILQVYLLPPTKMIFLDSRVEAEVGSILHLPLAMEAYYEAGQQSSPAFYLYPGQKMLLLRAMLLKIVILEYIPFSIFV